MEAMAKGIKPLIHNFVGAKNIYPEKYLWNSISEFLELILENEYNSKDYRDLIKDNYLLINKIYKIKELINSLYSYKNKFNLI